MSKKLNLMADALDDLLEAHRTESRSMEETKGRKQDLGPSEFDERNDRRHERDPRFWAEKRENEDPGLRINEAGQIRDHRESDVDILRQQRLRYFEVRRRRIHDTESRFLPHKKRGRNTDLGPIESDERTYRRHERDPRSSAEKRVNEDSGLRINESGQIRDHKESYADIRGNQQQQRLRGSEKQRRSHETGSSPYPVRPGVTNCRHYLINDLCSYGIECRFNHPPDLAPELPKKMQECKQFLRGHCRFGSSCSYIHSKERDGAAEPMPQARTIPDSRERDPRERFQDTSDDTVVDYKRAGIEQEERNVIGWQRMGAQEVLQEQRERQAQENVQRETEESVEERRLREMHPHDLVNIDKQRREDIQRERKEARLRLDQIKETAQLDEWSQPRGLMKKIGFGQSPGTEIKGKETEARSASLLYCDCKEKREERKRRREDIGE